MLLPDLENKKLLVVEDDDLSFLYLNQLLKLSKCSFIRVKNGIDALEQYRNDAGFDLILMDIQLPDMNGKEVTRRIRLHDPHIPVIAQTAAVSPDEQEQALQAGCTDVIVKPFSMETFFEVMGKHLM